MGIYLCEDAKEQTKRHPEERSDVGIYLCEDAKEQTKRHPEERSDVGIYLCEETKRQRKIATALKSLAMTLER